MTDPETATGAPGARSSVPGEDQHDESVGGVDPGARDLDAAPDPTASARDVLDNSGDSMGDDAVPPEEGLPGDGESITGQTDSASALGRTASA